MESNVFFTLGVFFPFLPYKIKKNYKADFQFSMAAIAGKDMMSASPNYDSHLQ